MEKVNILIYVVGVLAILNTQAMRAVESWLKEIFRVEFNKTGNQILSWVVTYILSLFASALGLIDVNWLGVILYGLISGLTSNGLWSIKHWFAKTI